MDTLTIETETASVSGSREYNRVPQVTPDFWIVKILAVTVGETAADFINMNLGLGLSTTSVIMGGLLIAALVFQFAQRKYIPWIYWLTVVLVSVVGTLITDTMVDIFGVSLVTSTVIFSGALAATFTVWYALEKRFQSIRSTHSGAKRSTGWLSSSLLHWVRQPETSPLNSWAWATFRQD